MNAHEAEIEGCKLALRDIEAQLNGIRAALFTAIPGTPECARYAFLLGATREALAYCRRNLTTREGGCECSMCMKGDA